MADRGDVPPAPRVLTPEYYAVLAEIEERHWWAVGMRRIATRLLDQILDGAGDRRVLDAGCGTGLTLGWARRYTRRAPIGLDLARPGLVFCARRGQQALVEGSALALPFQDHIVDLVFSMDVLQHLPRPDGDRQALDEMARVLRPGGLLVLRTNSRCGYPESHAREYQRYTLSEVTARVVHAGFQLRTATYVNFLPGLLVTLWRKVSAKPPGGDDPGLSFTIRPRTSVIGRVLYSALLLEALYLSRGRRSLPFGHSILVIAERLG